MEVYEQIYDRLSLLFNTQEIYPDDRLWDDIGADSLDLVELDIWAEETFNIEIPFPGESAEYCDSRTVGEYAEYIETKTY